MNIRKIDDVILRIEKKYNLSCLMGEVCTRDREIDNITFVHTMFINRNSLKFTFLLVAMYQSYVSVPASEKHSMNQMIDGISRLEDRLYVSKDIYEVAL
ncbi:hypothetical protein ACJDU8_21560 [Clostridium sp. WILCCON 0269]|uniref:Uncharacterized protein n=1 Tax=Candidatus Clostridium eludens TaxID=3381663 RepID=A0ABW8SPZ4_9CLOT